MLKAKIRKLWNKMQAHTAAERRSEYSDCVAKIRILKTKTKQKRKSKTKRNLRDQISQSIQWRFMNMKLIGTWT